MNFTVLALTLTARAMEYHPERPAKSNLGLMIVFHVKIRSSADTCFPSLHFAFFESVTRTVNGFLLRTFAVPMYGLMLKSGLTMSGLARAMPAVHEVHVLLQPDVKPLRHGGSCSAPKVIDPEVDFFDAPPAAPATMRLVTATSTPSASRK